MSDAAEHIDHEGKTMGMWFFLFTEILFFGGMFILYAAYRFKYATAFHAAAAEENLSLGTVNTAILLTSSLAIALAISALRAGKAARSIALQAATVFMGVVFLIIKYVEWSGKISEGIYPDSPVLLALGHGQTMFFGLYYMMTGLHGLHVLAGCVVICVMIYFTKRGVIDQARGVRLTNTGLYWHFVDIVWIFLYPLFYLVT